MDVQSYGNETINKNFNYIDYNTINNFTKQSLITAANTPTNVNINIPNNSNSVNTQISRKLVVTPKLQFGFGSNETNLRVDLPKVDNSTIFQIPSSTTITTSNQTNTTSTNKRIAENVPNEQGPNKRISIRPIDTPDVDPITSAKIVGGTALGVGGIIAGGGIVQAVGKLVDYAQQGVEIGQQVLQSGQKVATGIADGVENIGAISRNSAKFVGENVGEYVEKNMLGYQQPQINGEFKSNLDILKEKYSAFDDNVTENSSLLEEKYQIPDIEQEENNFTWNDAVNTKSDVDPDSLYDVQELEQKQWEHSDYTNNVNESKTGYENSTEFNDPEVEITTSEETGADVAELGADTFADIAADTVAGVASEGAADAALVVGAPEIAAAGVAIVGAGALADVVGRTVGSGLQLMGINDPITPFINNAESSVKNFLTHPIDNISAAFQNITPPSSIFSNLWF